VEFRFRTSGYSWRYRNRLKIERDWRIASIPFTSYAHVESFYDSRFGDWHQFEFEGGLVFPAGKYLAFEPYYARQIARSVEPQYVNGLGLTVDVYLRK
jgi:hypothetical protein